MSANVRATLWTFATTDGTRNMSARPPKPPEIQLIEDHRRAAMSVRNAASLAGLSESRWRQLEAGGREVRGTWLAEEPPARTLARMAWAVGVKPAELREAGRPDAAGVLEELTPEYEAEADVAEAERLVSAVRRPLSMRQRGALAERVVVALREIRDGSD